MTFDINKININNWLLEHESIVIICCTTLNNKSRILTLIGKNCKTNLDF